MSTRGLGWGIAMVVALGACSGDSVDLYAQCTIADSDGRLYFAKDLSAAAALEVARSNCALGARDPTSCSGTCQPSK